VLLYADVQSRRDSRAVRLVEHTDRLCLVALDDFGSHNWCERARGSDYAELTSPKSLAQQAIARRRRHNREVGIAVDMDGCGAINHDTGPAHMSRSGAADRCAVGAP